MAYMTPAVEICDSSVLNLDSHVRYIIIYNLQRVGEG